LRSLGCAPYDSIHSIYLFCCVNRVRHGVANCDGNVGSS
jgi:hypothetical protein